MCGITGKVCFIRQPSKDAVEKMTAGLTHRGPDFGAVKAVDTSAVLGHRRLSIIDLSSAANQPMTDAGKRYTIVYNGEVYNFRELKTELQKQGYSFASSSDTEVVLYSFMHWGVSCFAKFNGMFALAVWDSREKTLVCARDRFGKKPLYYTLVNGEFSFASELSALLLDSRIRDSVTVSIEALNHFFALGYILAPCSLYREIYKLEPATYLRYSANGITEKTRYWDYCECFQTRAKGPENDIAATVAGLLQESVKKRLVADVPVGALLSGGLDSSAVCATACRAADGRIETFNVGFELESYDESADASFTAQFLKTEHHRVSVNIATELPFIERAVRLFDEPFADTSLVPMAAVARFASSKVKVVLSGDGADELFGGYATYRADDLRKRLAHFLPRAGRAALARLLSLLAFESEKKTNTGFKMKQFAKGVAADHRYAHYAWRELFSEEQRIKILGREHEAEIRDTHPFGRFKKHYDEAGGLDVPSQHLYVDAKTWLADDILVKVDRATMAYSLEARSPFLDPELAAYAASIPWKYKTASGGKYILKKAMRGLLPVRTIYKKKSGFNAPVGAWLGNTTGEDEFRFFVRHVAGVKKLLPIQ
jgi:asparagine synthase (glutamine-hydrolysing)